MKDELTLNQIKRQDFVDNEIFDLIKRLNPTDEDIFEWDIDYISRIRDIIFSYHLYYRSINILEQPKQLDELEMKFYPYIPKSNNTTHE